MNEKPCLPLKLSSSSKNVLMASAILLTILVPLAAQNRPSAKGKEFMHRNNAVDYVEFSATDIEKTKQFYSAVFGWKFTDYGPEYTAFSDGRLSGGFQKVTTVAVPGTLVVIFVDDLEAAKSRVKAAGGNITKDTFTFPGGARFHFKDPSGNEVAVWHEDERQ
jgi:predicted enzyme related to lactoylglutathione lyase